MPNPWALHVQAGVHPAPRRLAPLVDRVSGMRAAAPPPRVAAPAAGSGSIILAFLPQQQRPTSVPEGTG